MVIDVSHRLHQKACVADNLARFVDDYFKTPATTTAGCWTAVLFYARKFTAILAVTPTWPSRRRVCWVLNSARISTSPTSAPTLQNSAALAYSLSIWLRDYLYIPWG